MAYTIADYRASTEDKLTGGVIDTMLDDAGHGATSGGGLLRVLPVVTMNALSMEFIKVNTEGPASGVAFRPINGNFPESTMTYYSETIVPSFVGGDVSIDLAFLWVDNYVAGTKPDVSQVEMKSRLINRTVNNALLNGDRSTDANSFSGMRKWVDSTQVLNVTDVDSTLTNGLNIGTSFSTANGKTFLTLIDRLLDYVGGAGEQTTLGFNWYARWAAFRSIRDSGFYQTTKDAYDRTLETYRGSPIINFGSKTAVETLSAGNTDTNAVSPNNFTFGSAVNAAEIWAFRANAEDGCAIYEVKPLDSRVVAEEAHAAPQKIIRIDWSPTFYPKRKDAIAVLRGVIVK